MIDQSQPGRCAFCGEPFPFVGGRAQSWRTGERYACNEFCADGVEDMPGNPNPGGQPAAFIGVGG